MDSSKPFPVTVHPVPSQTPQTYAYELVLPSAPSANTTPSPPSNALVFIGGLGDGPHTVPYIRTVAHQLSTTPAGRALGFSIFELRLSSAFASYGTQRLVDDVVELAALVRYLRHTLGRAHIVLMGHSTGCQDSMAYAASVRAGQSPPIDGLILQGPVSDREALVPRFAAGEYERSLAAAERMIAAGRANDLMRPEDLPAMIETPHTAFRWHSFVGVNGDDDFFSTDLPDTRLADAWGALAKPVLVLPSEHDEWVPKTIDVAANIARWSTFCSAGIFSDLSGQIPGASHRVEQPDAQLWLADRVLAFLARLV